MRIVNKISIKSVIILACLSLNLGQLVAQKRPNILFICSDQHAYKYGGFADHPYVKTPNLDQLAQEGVIFNAAYSGAPVCTPGRASLMTGMYASDVGSYGNSTVWDGTYPVWGTYFKKNGYYTQAFGKLDLDDNLPMGFETTAFDNGHRHHPDITSLFRMPLGYRVGEREKVDGRVRNLSPKDHDIKITQEALKFLNKKAGQLNKPWVLYLGYLKPHPPFAALGKYYNEYYPDKVDMPKVTNEELENLSLVYQDLRHFKRIATPISEDRIRKARAAYYGMISELDENIGKVIQALKENGDYDNTIIIYTSDHGESLGEHGLWFKNNLYDCAIRIPLIIKGPKIPSGKKIETPVAQLDLTPTMLQYTGIEIPTYLRGKTLSRFFEGKNNKENVVYAENHSEGNSTGSFMIRKGNWKYIYFSYFGDLLFNLKDDPGETNNLADSTKYSEVKANLKKELLKRVRPDEITADAFLKQEKILHNLAEKHTEDELFNILKGRLGDGQARIIAAKLKGRF